MKTINNGDKIRAAIDELRAAGFAGFSARTIATKVAESTGLSVNYLRQHEAVVQLASEPNRPAQPGKQSAPDGVAGKVEVERGENYIKASGDGFATVDEFIREAGIDLNDWRIVKVTTGRWYMGYKDANTQEAHKLPLYTIKIEAAPVDKKKFDYLKVRDQVIADMNAAPAPKYQPLQRVETPGGCLVVIDAADTHFGKYAAAIETGDDYNLDIARRRVLEGVAGIIGQAIKAYEIDRILLVVGNDVLHVDNSIATTTNGTFQNTDGLWFEMFQAAKQTFIDVIESLIPIADIDVVFNPSNHDYTSGYMLVDSLASWFRNSKNVTFTAGPAHRKYYQYGNSLIGTTHGDGAKPVDLPALMSHEVPKMWAATKYRYFYTHHIHHKDRTRFLETKDFIGMTVEALRSPSATDSWHGKKGYTGVVKAVEGFIHSKEKGQIARLTHVF